MSKKSDVGVMAMVAGLAAGAAAVFFSKKENRQMAVKEAKKVEAFAKKEAAVIRKEATVAKKKAVAKAKSVAKKAKAATKKKRR